MIIRRSEPSLINQVNASQTLYCFARRCTETVPALSDWKLKWITKNDLPLAEAKSFLVVRFIWWFGLPNSTLYRSAIDRAQRFIGLEDSKLSNSLYSRLRVIRIQWVRRNNSENEKNALDLVNLARNFVRITRIWITQSWLCRRLDGNSLYWGTTVIHCFVDVALCRLKSEIRQIDVIRTVTNQCWLRSVVLMLSPLHSSLIKPCMISH